MFFRLSIKADFYPELVHDDRRNSYQAEAIPNYSPKNPWKFPWERYNVLPGVGISHQAGSYYDGDGKNGKSRGKQDVCVAGFKFMGIIR